MTDSAWRWGLVMGVVLMAACAPSSDGGSPGSGGASGTAGSSGSTGNAGNAGNAGTTGSGGSTTGTGGTTGGSAAGTTGGSATGTAGSTAGTGGAAAGRGGATAGAGGAAGNAGRGGAAGTSARGGSGGSAAGGRGGAGGSQGGTSGAGSGDEYVSGVTVTVNSMVATILTVSWTQAKAADQVWLEFSFAGSSVMTSRMVAGATGAHKDSVLGVPGSTAVTIRIVSRQGGVDYKTRDYTGTTGAVPAGMPQPTLTTPADPTMTSSEKWILGSVEAAGGCTNDSCYFVGPYWIYIMDRQGRIVWYYTDTSSNASSQCPRVARDGEYIWIDKARTGTRSVLKTTLDRTTYSQTVSVPSLSDSIDVTTDGALIYDTNAELREMNKAGTVRTIWNCRAVLGGGNNCYSNTINWNPVDDTILMSFPEFNAVRQINRQTGEIIATYGDPSGSYTFSPSTWSFEWQHYPIITSMGTLLVSTHLSAFPDGSTAGANQHAFVELTIDRTAKRLTEKWSYTGAYWAQSRGMAMRLANGNLLVNYGTAGFIQEVTPSKQVVFQAKFDHPTQTISDQYNRMLGYMTAVEDLYALNGGGPK